MNDQFAAPGRDMGYTGMTQADWNKLPGDYDGMTAEEIQMWSDILATLPDLD